MPMPYNQDLEKIKQFIFSATGLIYYQDKTDELYRKIHKAMKHSGAADYRHYLSMITASADEGSVAFERLVSDLTIGETHFFRDESLFNGFRDVILPEVIKKNRAKKRLWIWSAGCATGEEAYTLAILIAQHFPHLLQGWDLRIIGTDINRDFLNRAIKGEYSQWSFRGTPEQIKQTCFFPKGRNWQIKPEYKKHLSFQYHNLATMPFPSVFQNLNSFDIIFCRNVMIYFDAATNQKLIRQFQESLVPDGWLVIGHADHNIRYFTSFKTVMLPGTSFYQNCAGHAGETPKETARVFEPFLFDLADAGGKSISDKKKTAPLSTFRATNNHTIPPVRKPRHSPCPPPEITRQKPVEKQSSDSAKLNDLINQGKWDEASRLCQHLIKLSPLDTTVHLLSALLSEHRGLVPEAVTSLKKALYLDRKFVLGHYHLGLLQQATGDVKKAKKSFSNVINLLDTYDDTFVFHMADGISAGQLKILSNFHLEVLNA